jgi:hypothetical protein
MLKKAALSISIFICIVYNVLAQDYLKLGHSLESKKTDRTYALIDYDSNGYALMRSDKEFKYAETETYDKNLKLLNSFVSTPEQRNYGGVLNLEGRLYMLFSKYRLNTQLQQYEDVSLWAMPMNKDSFCVGSDSFALVEPFTLKSALYRGNYVLSPDRSKLLVYDWEEEGDIEEVKGLTNEIMLRVYDNRFNLLWSRKVYLAPNSSGKRVMSIKKLRVSNSGEAAIMTDYFRNHRSYSLKEVTADPTLFFVGEKVSDFSRLTPNLGNLFFNELDFMYDADGNIIWFGFYSNRKYHQQAGYFYIKINAARNKILSKKINSFDQEIMKSLLKKKTIKSSDELRNFEIAFFKISKNGDLIMSAERRPYGVANYKSHDILLLRFDSLGNALWSKHIFKYNIFPQSLKVFLDHYMLIDKEDVYLFFNQGIYNETGLAKAVKVDKSGNLKEKTVVNYISSENVICPILSSPLPEGKIFINLQSRFFKYHQSGILDFRKLFEDAK